jgi:hypothetical protein
VALVSDLHHIAFVTADLDRLISFFERIFDSRRDEIACDHGGRGLSDSRSVAVTPDGQNVSVASEDRDAVAVFARC